MSYAPQTYYAKNRERILAQAKQRNALRRAGLPVPGRARRSAEEIAEYRQRYREANREKAREKASAYWKALSPEERERRLARAKNARRRNLGAYLLSGAQARAASKKLPFKLQIGDVEALLSAGQCECCERFVGPGAHEGNGDRRRGPTADAATLDRVVPSLGYTPDNVALLCWKCNRAKGDSTLEQLERLTAWLRKRLSP